MSTVLHGPGEAARRMGVAERTFRFWSRHFAAWLTPDAIAIATGSGFRHRRYSDADLVILERVRQLSAQRLSLQAIAVALGEPRTPVAPANGDPSELPRRQPAPAVGLTPSDEAAVGQSVAPAIARRSLAAPDGSTVPNDTDAEPLPVGDDPGDQPSVVPVSIDRAEQRPAPWRQPADERGLAVLPSAFDRRPAAPDLADQLAGIEARLAAVETLLVDLVSGLADLAPPSPPIRRWWWPFGKSRLLPPERQIGRRLTRLMADRMLTRQELAARAGLPLATVQALLTGRATPRPAERAALAAALDVPEADITERS